MTDDNDDPDERGRYVFCERPRCPECGDVRLRSYRSIDQGDGSLCIPSVSDMLPWNLTHGPSLSGPR